MRKFHHAELPPPSSLTDSRKTVAKISRLKVSSRVREYISSRSKLRETISYSRVKTIDQRRESNRSTVSARCCETPRSFVDEPESFRVKFHRLPAAARLDSSCWVLISNLTCSSPGNRSLFAHMCPRTRSPFQPLLFHYTARNGILSFHVIIRTSPSARGEISCKFPGVTTSNNLAVASFPCQAIFRTEYPRFFKYQARNEGGTAYLHVISFQKRKKHLIFLDFFFEFCK